MQALTTYLLALDALKQVERKNYITANPKTSDTRRENSAEHSWHLAMACWAFADYFDIAVNQEKLLKMALVHDIGEIDAGDTFLYDPKRDQAHIAERVGVARLARLSPPNHDVLNLWDEQETGTSLETKLLKTVDRLLPFMLNMVSEGGAWRDLDIKRLQVEKALAFIADDFPQVHDWMMSELDRAVAQGWLAY